MANSRSRPDRASGPGVSPEISDELKDWLTAKIGPGDRFSLCALGGGNSNETLLLERAGAALVMRRPPGAEIDASAHNIGRELRMLEALQGSGVPAPAPIGLCTDPDIPEAPFLLMKAVGGVSLTERTPASAGDPAAAARAVGEQVIDALADLHSLAWAEIGLEDYGRPDGFLGRQVGRWRKQLQRYSHRELADFEPVAEWLERNRPGDGEPGILHGDFHVDNCLIDTGPPPCLRAIIDWEMSTIGDPLLDVGLFLAFWGEERSEPLAMARIQGFSRVEGAPSRAELALRYEARSGRSLERLGYYMALAFWKLAAIVEGAHAQHVEGRLDTDYAAALEDDVPALLREARHFAGC